MKQKKHLFSLITAAAFAFALITGCNSGGGDKPASGASKDITPSSQNKEAVAAFQEGLMSFDLGDTKKARAAFSKAIELDPKFGLAYLYRANLSTSTKEFVENVNKGKANIEGASEWEKMYADFQTAGLSGDRKKQIELLEKIAAANPDAARAQVDLGNAYFSNNEFDKAKTSFEKAMSLDPKWVGGHSGMAAYYLFGDKRDPKKAEEHAAKVVELAPKSSGAEILLGDVYRAQNDFQKARDSYAKAVTLDPDSPDGYSKEGNANTYLGNYDDARKNFMDGGSHDVNKTNSFGPVAYTYLYANGDYKTAIKTLRDAVAKIDAASAGATGEENNLLNNVAAIAFHYNDAATLKELAPRLTVLSEKINNELGTPEGKIYAKADALNWQATIAMGDGKYDDAKARLEEMKTAMDPIKDDRKLEGYHYMMGRLAMMQKNYADAVTHFGAADPNQIYNKYWLAMANEMAGNKDKATELYKEVAAYNFNDVGNALVRSEVKKKIGS